MKGQASSDTAEPRKSSSREDVMMIIDEVGDIERTKSIDSRGNEEAMNVDASQMLMSKDEKHGARREGKNIPSGFDRKSGIQHAEGRDERNTCSTRGKDSSRTGVSKCGSGNSDGSKKMTTSSKPSTLRQQKGQAASNTNTQRQRISGQPPHHHLHHQGPQTFPPFHPQQQGRQMHHQPRPLAHLHHPGAPAHHPGAPPLSFPPHGQFGHPGSASVKHDQFPGHHHGGPPPHPHYQQGGFRHPGQPGGPYNPAPSPHPPSFHSGPSPHPGIGPPHHPSFHHQQMAHHMYHPPQHSTNPYPGTNPQHSSGPPHYRGGLQTQQQQHHLHAMGGAQHQLHKVPSFSQTGPPSRVDGSSSASVSSASSTTKKKGQKDDQKKNAHNTSIAGSSTTSSGSRKKRTIDGVQQEGNKEMQGVPPTLPGPSLFTVQRSNSTTSTCSTVTAGLNTSNETPSLADDSPLKIGAGRVGSNNNLLRANLSRESPFQPPSANLFADEKQLDQINHHRRSHSAASTASSLSVGGLSMSSYDGGKGRDSAGFDDDPMCNQTDDTPMLEASPKRRKSQRTPSVPLDSTMHKGSSIRNDHRRGDSTDTLGAPGQFDHLSVNDDIPKSSSSSSMTLRRHGGDLSISHHRRISSGTSSMTCDTANSRGGGNGMFVTLSTSPINHGVDPGATPVSKNTSSRTIDSSTVFRRTKDDAKGSNSTFSFRSKTHAEDRSDGAPIVLQAPGAGGSGSSRYFSDQQLQNSGSSTFDEPGVSNDSTPHYSKRTESPTCSENNMIDGGADTPTPSLPSMTGGDMLPDEHLLNRHLRGQSFTPLPHVANGGEGRGSNTNSPTFNPALSAIAPQLSWSIAGDTPPLGDLADWDEDRQHSKSSLHKRSDSNASQMSSVSRGTSFSPFWREEDGVPSSTHKLLHSEQKNGDSNGGDGRDYENILRLTTLSPHSDIGMTDDEGLGGKTTPLPIFFDQPTVGEERENMMMDRHRSNSLSPTNKGSNHKSRSSSIGQQPSYGEPEHIYQMFVTNGGRGSLTTTGNKLAKPQPQQSRIMPLSSASSWTADFSSNSRRGPPHHHQSPGLGMNHHSNRIPPTPTYSSDQRDDRFSRNEHTNRRDGPPEFYSSSNMFSRPAGSGSMMGGPPGSVQGDRVRNLRGRAPPSPHHAPPPLHIPPHISSAHQHNLTSPMAAGLAGKNGIWRVHPGGVHSHSHPSLSPHHHHVPSMEMIPSRRKCVPLKPPIPSKFQGDIEKFKNAQVPEFTSLVNFPAHISQKQNMNLPEGMRCCVMCGQACPCSAANKNKKNAGGKGEGKSALGSSGGFGAANKTVQDATTDKQSSASALGGGYAIIPTQNKGLCTLCDVNVWVVTQSGLEIKWCKGCKNFRPWAAFGDKGLATKCVRCRERQREKYAMQKEEKEKARLNAKNGAANSGKNTKATTE